MVRKSVFRAKFRSAGNAKHVLEPWDILKGTVAQPRARVLSNDMMIFYAPKSIYEDKMTVLEMICSSVCITSMICFSMEVKYGHLLDTSVHMQDTRVAARGNAISFLIPWQSILAELRKIETAEMRVLLQIYRFLERICVRSYKCCSNVMLQIRKGIYPSLYIKLPSEEKLSCGI